MWPGTKLSHWIHKFSVMTEDCHNNTAGLKHKNYVIKCEMQWSRKVGGDSTIHHWVMGTIRVTVGFILLQTLIAFKLAQ